MNTNQRHRTGVCAAELLFLFFFEDEELGKNVVADDDKDGGNDGSDVHIHAEGNEHLHHNDVEDKGRDAGEDEAPEFLEDIGVVAFKDPAAVHGVGNGNAGYPVDHDLPLHTLEFAAIPLLCCPVPFCGRDNSWIVEKDGHRVLAHTVFQYRWTA